MKFAESMTQLLQNIWPQERDFMARPDRFKYVRKLVVSDSCVFCDTNENETQPTTYKLYQTSEAMVVINKYPYNTGHLMVLPRRHCGDLLQLSHAEYAEVMNLIRTCMEILKAEYQPLGFNIGLNHGAVAGAGIPEHLHWHIVPRWAGDTNFFPIIAETKVLPETLEQTFSKLRVHFAKLKA